MLRLEVADERPQPQETVDRLREALQVRRRRDDRADLLVHLTCERDDEGDVADAALPGDRVVHDEQDRPDVAEREQELARDLEQRARELRVQKPARDAVEERVLTAAQDLLQAEDAQLLARRRVEAE